MRGREGKTLKGKRREESNRLAPEIQLQFRIEKELLERVHIT